MKIYDIVDEAPVSAVDRAKQKVGSMASRGQARKSEVSQEANQVAKELKALLQGASVDLNEIPVKTFVDFMKRKGYDDNIEQQVEKFVDSSDPDAVLNKKQAENVLLSQVKSASLSDQGAAVSKGKFARDSESQTKKSSSAAQGAKDFASGFKQGWTGKKPKDKKTTAKSPSKKGSAKTANRDFDKFKNQIDQLSDKQKQDLLKQLQQ